jgi:hypothetical protein
VLATHGSSESLVRWLNEHGRDAHVWHTEWSGEAEPRPTWRRRPPR